MYTKEIFSEDGEKILHINIPNSFINPCIIFDIFKDKEKTPEIKHFTDLNILKDIDFVLYAQPTKEPWAKRQKNILILREETSPVEENFLQVKKLPANHYLECDVANCKIRLIGPFVNKDSVGEWMVY